VKFLFNRSGKEADRLYKLGCHLSKEGKDLEAIEEYEKAIKIKLEYKEAWGNMANSLTRLGRYKQAIVCYDKALDLDSKYFFA
jgi:tetratricopeptide (TPR) repeat protein